MGIRVDRSHLKLLLAIRHNIFLEGKLYNYEVLPNYYRHQERKFLLGKVFSYFQGSVLILLGNKIPWDMVDMSLVSVPESNSQCPFQVRRCPLDNYHHMHLGPFKRFDYLNF